jgi:glycosyltransferase involved in cell wall biosynthesis
MAIVSTALALKDLPDPPQGKTGWPWTEQSEPLPDKQADGSDWPRISIVTPSYNQGQFIEETIRSVLLQGYPNLEYIIIDGGSTDNSVDIIKKYEQCLAYWISGKDEGQADAINKGLLQSNGSIIGWINSDDLYIKNTFKKIFYALHNNPSCVLVHGNRILIDQASNVTGWSPQPKFNPMRTGYTIASETAFWQRNAMEMVGLLKKELKFAMDLEFFLRLYLHGNFLKLNDYLGCFRCYAYNKSSTIAEIGQIEAQQEWKNLLGYDIPAIKQKSKYRKLLPDLIKNPLLIALPYIAYKLKQK